ncbi:alpha-hydroxy acid oxidase [Yersinia aldovae]|uniref:alpha-hydroxy acid oxidase n=1 Tax=Yersinia aldovae TaxID=29483 RepID=UPI0011A0B01F|nr:alpha-hydroxy acid oxidase [Yersinia aldovae]
MSVITNIEDLRAMAQRRVPKMFYEFADSGSWTESTYHANEADFKKILLRQRVGCDLSQRSLKTQMLGIDVAMPLALSPVGLQGMLRADGEILAAKAAAAFGVRYTLSTMSVCSLEDIAEHTRSPFWFQLYVMRDKNFMLSLINRAKEAGCDALVLTLDLQVIGDRHKDARNGLSTPPKMTLKNILNMMSKPAWCMGMLGTSRRNLGNIMGHAKNVDNMKSLSSWIASQFDPSLSWDDVEWIKLHWGGKLIIKGILDAEDARRAQASGVDAIIVSNHGGRQLDGAPSSISALPPIIDAVGANTEVWLDSGIRSGQDVLKALALGAHATMIGRSFLWGLAAQGEQGVTKALDIIYKELDLSMAFCGHTHVGQVGRSTLIESTIPRLF